jgi:sugar phosphate isomerase/epimerase
MRDLMKYAICNEVYQDWPLETAFAHASRVGYGGIEIAPFTVAPKVTEISAERRRTIRATANDAGLTIIGLHWLLAGTEGLHLTTDDAMVRRKTLNYLIELTELCRDLGGTIMVLGSPQQRNLPNHVSPSRGSNHATEILRGLVPALTDCGVTLALEPLGPEECNFLTSADEAIELACRVDSACVKLHLDTKAMSTESKSIPAIISDSRDWLVHFHANDPNRRGPGMGQLDFRPIVQALREINYQGWISVEVFDFSPGIMELTSSINYLRSVEQQLDERD